jgi:hypothetical protein
LSLGVKAIKLYAWEGPYRERIQELRAAELRAIRTTQILSMVTGTDRGGVLGVGNRMRKQRGDRGGVLGVGKGRKQRGDMGRRAGCGMEEGARGDRGGGLGVGKRREQGGTGAEGWVWGRGGGSKGVWG